MFLPKRHSHNIDISKDTGMTIQLIDNPNELIDSTTPDIQSSLRV